MGNAALRDIAVIEDVPFSEIEGVVAVDAHNWLYRYLTTTVKWTSSSKYTTADGTEVANLIGIVQGLPKFFENDVTPVMVFDGGPSELKEDEIESRREQRQTYEEQLETAREEGDEVAIAQLESRTQRLTPTIQETSRELLRLLDVPIVEAPAEGEAQAAHMVRRGDADYVGSEDYDALLFGAPYTLRQLTSKGDPELMDLEATLDHHDLTLEQLIDAAILIGTDFNEGISGIGPKTALTEISEHGDLWSVLEARGETLEYGDRVRALFREPNVTDEYEFETTLDPDIEAAREYVTEEWGVDADEVARGFERIEESVTQTGLDRWT
ncbi:flap endonuclease Fen1 [Natrialba magadii ATCC 43099]|uniref:Flap endonuclease 1 n=1 Tax=Natrialba magadii (strain ATCC 43099 / DSM 3394 / CCM 3739 / CIP 104546 / IAM 13178 / JCM 8861 / NBRC 102185 / NCIMB 2190 / MS3) TaxID=547559 RepID=D3SS07_NATMM|nr:flap endonuclease-1 [Natrialba magadii]ADD06781.1 flap endonuclease Fen1 [Natrialba magadii ATCC 43099]ELY27783.1 flap endonuclease-1 [Natrialba magadii ATCC 43099]